MCAPEKHAYRTACSLAARSSAACVISPQHQPDPFNHRHYRPVHFRTFRQQCLVTSSNSAPGRWVHLLSKQHAPFVHAPRDNPRPAAADTNVSPTKCQRPPPSIHVFSPELGSTQFEPTEVAVGESTPSKQQFALLVVFAAQSSAACVVNHKHQTDRFNRRRCRLSHPCALGSHPFQHPLTSRLQQVYAIWNSTRHLQMRRSSRIQP